MNLERICLVLQITLDQYEGFIYIYIYQIYLTTSVPKTRVKQRNLGVDESETKEQQ